MSCHVQQTGIHLLKADVNHVEDVLQGLATGTEIHSCIGFYFCKIEVLGLTEIFKILFKNIFLCFRGCFNVPIKN